MMLTKKTSVKIVSDTARCENIQCIWVFDLKRVGRLFSVWKALKSPWFFYNCVQIDRFWFLPTDTKKVIKLLCSRRHVLADINLRICLPSPILLASKYKGLDQLDVLHGHVILDLLPILSSDNSARLFSRSIAGMPGWHGRTGVPILSPTVKWFW